MPTRKIIHLDLDAFFCAVEELHDPSLVGTPFAVGGKPDQRGVVASCSYAARAFGVRSGMPMALAIKRCPELKVISSHYHKYGEVSEKVMEELRALSPLVEQISIDEAFIDVSDLPLDAEKLASDLQKKINTSLKLPCSLGVASNKLVAKIANDHGKSLAQGSRPPNAITNVPPGKEAEFLAPLPVIALWGVGPKTAQRLESMDIKTIGDLARISEVDLVNLFGKNGYDLAKHAKGVDERPIITSHETKSISQETTFPKDIHDKDILRKTLYRLSERVGARLRKSHLAGSTVKIKLRWSDFTTISRQMTLDQPTNQGQVIYDAALQLLKKELDPAKKVRLIGVGVSGLGTPSRQLGLWDESSDKDRRLQEAIDSLRERYGPQTLQKGIEIDDSH